MTIPGFQLTMPNVASWNGKWSREDKFYFRSRNIYKKDEKKILHEILKNKAINDFYYRWDDGWGANVEVSIITAQEARKLNKKSVGFCGYDWMIDSILKHGKIIAQWELEKIND